MFSVHTVPLSGDDNSGKLIGTGESRGDNRGQWYPTQGAGNGFGLSLPKGCKWTVSMALVASGLVPICLWVAHKPNLWMTCNVWHDIHKASPH
jgi:hypothetical protein